MKINKIRIQNYKLFKNEIISVNEGYNIFVGNNDSGKSTLLELLQIVISGKLNNYSFDRQLKISCFNQIIRKEFINKLEQNEEVEELPKISAEIYFNDEGSDSELKGTNNSLGENCPGIQMSVNFNPIYADAFKEMLDAQEIYDIPVEFYEVKWTYFSGDPVIFRKLPFKVSLLDTTKKDYSNSVNKFVNSNVAEHLTDEEKASLARNYRKMKYEFNSNKSVISLNERIEENVRLDDKKIKLGIKEEVLDAWKNEVSIDVEDVPFDDIGFGSQNLIKMELALNEESQKSNFILFEEPENNLSFSNMSKLISKINHQESKQVFISTHSSFVANKIGLKNIILLHEGNITPFNEVNEETMDFFMKLPGYNTLRFLLAEKVILVEGPTDELIVQKAYFDKYGKLPIQDGTDIIAVDSLAFKRYCDLAILVYKDINLVTDNDGDIEENILDKYKDYIDEYDFIQVFYEKEEALYSLEPSMYEANAKDDKTLSLFKKAISKSGSMERKSKEQIIKFMENNKAEWGLRVFDSKEKVEYPEYIKNAITK
ncbi:ATP-dependent nuclease [Paraliobacillus ryukyuensis]|uniref:ATP-dependent nuclease n=1 Tax=Paraliobacillus ryukyuensis TaxID=200904 RepID=UPI0009A57551|nr:AAA family ATPase [Paraliobacillus ryukyuensis]